jgi:hypothetical protein
MRTNDVRTRRVWTRGIAIALFSLMLGGCGSYQPLAQIQRYLPYPFGEPDEPESDPAEDAGKRPKGQSAPPPASRVD